MADGELRDLEPVARVPHGAHELADADALAVRAHVVDTLVDAGLDRVDRVVEAQPALEVLLWSPTDFAVDDAVGAEVVDEVAGDATQAVRGLHDCCGHVEGLQVLDERPRVGLVGEPVRELGRICRWKFEADLVGKLDDRLGAQPTVEVVVQRDLRQRTDVGAVPQREIALVEWRGALHRHGVPLRMWPRSRKCGRPEP